MNAMAAERLPRWDGGALRGVLLDLDGTLLDTADDIAKALNRALADMHFAALPTVEVRNMIGGGAPTLIDRALARLGADVRGDARAMLLERFEFHYEQMHRLKIFKSRVYPGVAEGLRGLRALGLKLAVVTNKAQPFAVKLLQDLGLHKWIDVVVGGDSSRSRKPSPEPLFFACSELHIEPCEALMVGDSINDVAAARAAGIPVVCVPYGYNEGNDSRHLACDVFIESLAELPRVLSGTLPASK